MYVFFYFDKLSLTVAFGWVQPMSEWKKPKETSKCVVSYWSAVNGDGPWESRQYDQAMQRYAAQ